MSVATKRKHVAKEVMEQFVLPDDDRQIVQVLEPKGNNLHEVLTPNGERFLASMPTKFRNFVWIKRGDFVMVEQIKEGLKVKGEICNILRKQQIEYIQQQGLWPAQFNSKLKPESSEMIPQDMLPPSDDESAPSDAEEDAPRTFFNPNRPHVQYYDDNDSEDSDENEESVEN